MKRTDMTSNDLDRACAQVGLFMYHFANLENQIDAAFAKLFELKDNTAQMINGSVDFLKRYNLVRTAVRYQVDENEYKRLKEILTKVTDYNNARQVVAHSRFEPAGDGVKFTRVVARDGTVTIPDETWSKEKFETQYKAMQKTTRQLKDEIVAKVKPAKGYMMAFEPGDYATASGEVKLYVSPSVNPVDSRTQRRRR
jgi:hypothetical protein